MAAAAIAVIAMAATCDGASQKGNVVRCTADASAKPKDVPELMTTSKGAQVTSVGQWEKVRAPELLDIFTRNEYGRRPVERPEYLRFEEAEPESVMMDGKALRKRIRVCYGGKYGKGSFVLTAFIPRQEKPAPAFVLICNRSDLKKYIDPTRRTKSGYWPAEEIVARGYAAITFYNGDIAPDWNTGNREGVFKCFEPAGARKGTSLWGTLSAWAWGASRVLDWIETDTLLDAKRVAVVGHSRGGKTALVAAVYDKRFAMACSNCSGCSGAKLNHIYLPKSEHISQIIKNFPYWFCQNYFMYANLDHKLPFDQHQFIALIAPRLVCVASATDDKWAGPLGEWWSAKLASPAWELYGKKGLVADTMPAPDSPQQDGCVSYHIRTGSHELTSYDWNRYMDFADKHGWRK